MPSAEDETKSALLTRSAPMRARSQLATRQSAAAALTACDVCLQRGDHGLAAGSGDLSITIGLEPQLYYQTISRESVSRSRTTVI
jgi:hypothetical protein